MRKLFISVVALALLFICAALLPVAATEASISVSGTCGDNITWVLDSDGTLTISGSGYVYIDEHDSAPWCELADSIKNVIIEDGIRSIGESAFAGCRNLTDITIPNSVVLINADAFSRCSSLADITIPDSVTEIDYGAFYGCSSLTDIDIPSSVTTIGESAFAGCSNLKSLTVDPQNPVYHIDGNCLIKTDAKILHTGFSTSVIPTDGSVVAIGYEAFYGCIGLTEITIPDSVTEIDYYAFADCSDLVSIILPDTVTEIHQGAFYGCSSLESITIPHGVQEIHSNTFCGCSSLTTVVIPEGITSIDYGAFDDCSNLWHVLYKGRQYDWKFLDIDTNGNTPLVDAITHYNVIGNEVDSVNRTCTICSSPPTEPTESPNSSSPSGVTIPPRPETQPISPTEATNPTEPVGSNEPTADYTVWIIAAVVVILIAVSAYDIIFSKKKR